MKKGWSQCDEIGEVPRVLMGRLPLAKDANGLIKEHDKICFNRCTPSRNKDLAQANIGDDAFLMVPTILEQNHVPSSRLLVTVGE